MTDRIECKYCDAIGYTSDIHKDGWTLAKSHMFHYCCPHCQGKEKKLHD